MNTLQDQKTRYYWNQVQYHGKRYPKFHWPSVELLLNLIYTYDIIETHFAKRMAGAGLSVSAFNILMILSRHEQGCKQRDLSKLMLVSRANITGLVDSLVRRKFVLRSPDKTDRRATIVRITPKGESLLERVLPSHYEEIHAILSGMDSREKKVLNRSLEKLRALVLQRKKRTAP